jgi:glycosyltransferase involved in cell wall biosynthesis
VKIVIVGPAYPLRGAMAQLNVILGWYLSKHHDVHIVSFSRQYPSLLFPGKSQIDPGKPLFNVPTLQMIDSINPLSWFRTAWYLIGQNPDVLIFRYWMPFFAPCFGLISRMVKRKTHAQVIFICDNIVPHEKRFGDKALTHYAFKAVDAFVVLSKTVEEDLRRICPNARSVLTPLPLFHVFGEPQKKREARMKLELHAENVMLFFGYIRAYKGLDVLLDAMPRIIDKIPISLLIAGEFYEDEKKYRVKIQKLGLENYVRIHSHYISNEDISTYFSAADVVVIPCISATQSAVVPVAYHYNKPVIATRVGGLAEVIIHGQTGFLVPPQNPDAFADAVVKFYQENCESVFALHIEEEKKQYQWETFLERLGSLFKKNN